MEQEPQLDPIAPKPPAEGPRLEQTPGQPEIKLPPITPVKASGCNSRWLTLGCLTVLGLMVVALIAGIFSFDTGFVILVKRAQQQIWNNLPPELNQPQRTRTLGNLKAIGGKLKQQGDSYLFGEFLGRAGSALEDRKLTVEEVEQLNLYMEAVIAGSEPPAQLSTPDAPEPELQHE